MRVSLLSTAVIAALIVLPTHEAHARRRILTTPETPSISAPAIAAQTADLTLNGANGHPLWRLADEGHATLWTNGDIGGGAGSDNAIAGVVEIGGGYRFTKWIQGNVSVGKSLAGKDTPHNGRTTQDLTYIVPEATINLGNTSFWATLSGLYAEGDMDIKRGHVEEGDAYISKGSSHAKIEAIRARLDWRDAVAVSGFAFTPYLDQQHTETQLSAYSERGGAYPAQWNGRSQSDDITRVGVDVRKNVLAGVDLTATVEENHWWQGETANATGTNFDDTVFNVRGERAGHDWAHFGLGTIVDLGKNQITATANAITQGNTPQYWLALGYQYRF